ncbi:dethiobiotin synthetase [Serratia symbiotica str. 'Cinara cedri']|nr:dethiobiotin synthetase [Serratia symbiotica str. 'Cinara cedri']
MIKRCFVTGTDTAVGKTVASCALLQAAHRAGYCSVGYKPVASGGIITADGYRNSDALMLQSNSSVIISYDEVNPYIFSEPTSPHIISATEDRPIELERLSTALHNLEQRANWLLVEGIGGWLTPLSLQHTFAYWVQKEQLPVILVVGMKLGCINHALLTAQAILQLGLPLVGWIANNVIVPDKWHKEYLATLCYMLPAPLLGNIPYLFNIKYQLLGQYLDISLL